ncbi:hypothetical protein B0H12DRAFT_850304 [Mycena haematopus]|nr:hypothetical protein B0H12DRAFT_850304 [Mycena haematopus]
MDLTYALQALPIAIDLPPLGTLTIESCTALGKAVHQGALRKLDHDIHASTRLYLLHGRREPLEDKPPTKITVILRHYLELVVNAKHRKALTRLLVSQHCLAVERMRYKQHYHRREVPRSERLCRFGCGEVESVEHAIFFCDGSARLTECRALYLDPLAVSEPAVLVVATDSAAAVLKSLVFRRDTVCQVAKLAFKVLEVFNEEPMVWPDDV